MSFPTSSAFASRGDQRSCARMARPQTSATCESRRCSPHMTAIRARTLSVDPRLRSQYAARVRSVTQPLSGRLATRTAKAALLGPGSTARPRPSARLLHNPQSSAAAAKDPRSGSGNPLHNRPSKRTGLLRAPSPGGRASRETGRFVRAATGRSAAALLGLSSGPSGRKPDNTLCGTLSAFADS
jgi:hypothetical protein